MPSPNTDLNNVLWDGETYYFGSDEGIYSYSPNDITKVKINGQKILFDVAPIIEHGRTLVPIRAVCEVLGVAIQWDNNKINLNFGNNHIEVQIGNEIAFVNGVAKRLDVPAEIIDSRALVPLRFIAESLGCKVEWLDVENEIVITM